MRGLAHVTEKLLRQARALQENALDARDESARAAMERAWENAPVRTGALRASIRMEEGKVYTDCPYAGAVEFGNRHTAPQPFLSTAADGVGYLKTAQEKAREAIG